MIPKLSLSVDYLTSNQTFLFAAGIKKSIAKFIHLL